MYVQGPTTDPVRVTQTGTGRYVGHIQGVDDVEVFGPYPLDELIAVMADWLEVQLRQVRAELDALRDG